MESFNNCAESTQDLTLFFNSCKTSEAIFGYSCIGFYQKRFAIKRKRKYVHN